MAIALNNVSSDQVGNSTTLTFAHTVNVGSNKILIVGVALENGDTPYISIASVVFNTNESLTQIDVQAFDSSRNSASLWYLLNPTETTANIVVTTSGDVTADTAILAGAITIDGAKQQAPEADNKATGTSTTASVTVTTLTDNAWVIDCVSNSLSSNNMTVGAGQTERWEEALETRGNGSTEPVAEHGATAMSWTLANRVWGIVAAAFAPYVAPGGAAPTGTFFGPLGGPFRGVL